jgi:hypothetical protein
MAPDCVSFLIAPLAVPSVAVEGSDSSISAFQIHRINIINEQERSAI